MKKGAKILVGDCAGVKEGEDVLIVTDSERLAIAQALCSEAQNQGARATMAVCPPRSIDNEEPPRAVAEAMRASDVVFLPITHALAHTRATREAIGAGARILSMTAFTPGQMEKGGLMADFRARKPLCDALAARLSEAREVRVTNPAGTELVLSVEGRAGNSHACVLDGPGFTAVPNIEANISPLEGTASGVLVVDGSIPYYGVGVIEEPVTFQVEDGFVREISGGRQADFLDKLLAEQNDEWVYNVAQFAMGLNPECKDFTGEMLNDEGGERHDPHRHRHLGQLRGRRAGQDPLRRHHQSAIGLVRRRAHHPKRRNTAGRGMMRKNMEVRLEMENCFSQRRVE